MIQDLDNEIWKDINGYLGLYKISNFGRIKSLSNNKKRKERILIPGQTTKGYYQITLFKNNIGTKFHIHRLVAFYFIPNINNYNQVNHKDENKKHNFYLNLEWCDAKYNCNFGTRNDKIGGRKRIIQKDLKDNIINYFPSIKKASELLNIPYNSIRNCLSGYYIDSRTKQKYNINHTHGFTFIYE